MENYLSCFCACRTNMEGTPFLSNKIMGLLGQGGRGKTQSSDSVLVIFLSCIKNTYCIISVQQIRTKLPHHFPIHIPSLCALWANGIPLFFSCILYNIQQHIFNILTIIPQYKKNKNTSPPSTLGL